tara:strand:- start:376 stop:1068 length:693 start_codon:yes stop_codon:yes gene_type:complete
MEPYGKKVNKNPLNLFMILMIKFYQFFLSPLLRSNCRFIPTCSEYSIESLKNFGFFKGSYLTFLRIIKCHPFGTSGIDQVKNNKSIQVKQISLSTIKKGRSRELYYNLPKKMASYSQDLKKSTIHFGLFVDSDLVSGLSIIKKTQANDSILSFQIRGMFSKKEEVSKGYGSLLLKFVKEKYQSKKLILWCNSRKDAINFYKKNGFKEESDYFNIENIGLHKKMVFIKNGK